MIIDVVQFFYPEIKQENIKKVSLLGLIFFFIVGAYWLLRLLKDLFFYDSLAFPISLGWSIHEGREALPYAKMISPLITLPVVIIYTKLVDICKKHQLFYVIISFYALAFSCVTGVMFAQSTYGNAYIGATLLKNTGYCAYWLTESFGYVSFAFFWSFTISSTPLNQAKLTFPFIIALGQLGAISGSAVMFLSLSVWMKYSIALLLLAAVLFIVQYLIYVIPANQMVSDKKEKHLRHDLYGDIKLLLTSPYLMGVLVVSTFYEFSNALVDYQMKSQAALAGMDLHHFLGLQGTSINILSFIIALLGTSKLMKKFGIRVCLLIYPVILAFMVTGLYMYYRSGIATPFLLAWAAFTVNLTSKAISYAVNNPIKDLMYIPTSDDVEFKVKGIIDMLGGRSAKGIGAKISSMTIVKGNPIASIHNLFFFGSLLSLGVIGLWILAALYVGYKNQQLVNADEVIE